MSLFRRLRRHLVDPASHHGSIARGFLWVSFFVLVGKLVAAAKEVAIAYRYGVAGEVDAYLFVFNLLSWPIAIWFNVLTMVLPPLAASIRQQAPQEFPRFRAELLGLTLLLGLALAGLSWVALPWLLRSSLTGLPGGTVNIAIDLVPPLIPLVLLGVLSGLFSAWMLTAGRHANTLLESVPALFILLAIMLIPDHGAEPLVWGTVVGFVVHLAGLAVLQARHHEIGTPSFSRQSSYWPLFWQGFGAMLAGQTLISVAALVDQFFAARMSPGAITVLTYSNRILALILGMGALAVSRATLPVFSQAQMAQGNQVYRIASHWVRIMFLLGGGALVAGWWLAPWGVGLLFERGAFTKQDTVAVAEVLRYGLTQLPFYFAGIVLFSLLASQRRHRAIALVAGGSLLVKLAAVAVLAPLLDINGIALATSIMYGATLLFLFISVRKGPK